MARHHSPQHRVRGTDIYRRLLLSFPLLWCAPLQGAGGSSTTNTACIWRSGAWRSRRASQVRALLTWALAWPSSMCCPAPPRSPALLRAWQVRLASTRAPSTGARASLMDSRRPAGGAPAHRARSPLPVQSLWHRARSLISPESPRARALSSSLWLHHPVSTPVPPAHCSGRVRHHSAPPRVCR